MAIRVQEVPYYTLPKDLLSYEPHDEAVIVDDGEESSRRFVKREVYLQTALTSLEQSQIEQFCDLCVGSKIKLSRTMMARALRYVHLCEGDVGEAVENCVESMAWRTSTFSDTISDADEAFNARLLEGIAYICGRDAELHPVIVFRVREAIERLWEWRPGEVVDMIAFMLEFIITHMLIPGKVEKYSVLLDMTGVSLWSVMRCQQPPQEAFDAVRQHYCKRLHSVYVVGLGYGVWSVFSRMLPRSKSKRIKFMSTLAELQKYFSATQLETKYGGTRENIEKYYPWTFVPGPFTAGYNGEPNYNDYATVHKALSRETCIGHIWAKEKLHVVYSIRELRWSPEAPAIFEALGLPSNVAISKTTRNLPNFKSEVETLVARGDRKKDKLPSDGDSSSTRQLWKVTPIPQEPAMSSNSSITPKNDGSPGLLHGVPEEISDNEHGDKETPSTVDPASLETERQKAIQETLEPKRRKSKKKKKACCGPAGR